jgi:ATP adenylyltransferase
MRYIKVLLLVLIFFVSMLFFFQNQEALGKEMALKLNLFFLPPMKPLALPTYFVLLAGFLLGALFAIAFLLWDKISLSAKLLKAQWKVRSLEKEVAQYATKAATIATPAEAKARFFEKKKKKDVVAPDPDKNT